METILLASSSPRRRELLESLSIPFTVLSPDVDETAYDALEPEFRVGALAEAKALAVRDKLLRESLPRPRLMLAADTLVVLGEGTSLEVIGKPENLDEARSMLTRLQGRTHRVYSGLCLYDLRSEKRETVVATTKVRFAPMKDKEIEEYLGWNEWQGAAGAYQIQGRASWYIKDIAGSWSCVVGLPIRELYGILSNAGYEFAPAKGTK